MDSLADLSAATTGWPTGPPSMKICRAGPRLIMSMLKTPRTWPSGTVGLRA